MTKTKNIFIILFIVSTNFLFSQSNPSENWHIQEELLPYVIPSLIEMGVPTSEKVIIYLRDLKGKTAGVALGRNKKGVSIILDSKNWNKSSYVDKHLLIWHEVGHDYFNMTHGVNKIMEEDIALNTLSMIDMMEMKSEFLHQIK